MSSQSTEYRMVEFEGNTFQVPLNYKQLSIDEDEAATLKREINSFISEELNENDNVLDAFSGVGFSAHLWAKKAKNVVCIEKDNNTFNYLKTNLARHHNVTLYNDSNFKIMSSFIGKNKFKLIDLDPWNNFTEQLPLVTQLMDSGILLLTSGEIFHMMRFASTKKYGDCSQYRGGDNYYKWVPEVLIPHIKNVIKCDIIYYYIYPTSVRIVATVGNYQLSSMNKEYLSMLPKFIGKLRKFDR